MTEAHTAGDDAAGHGIAEGRIAFLKDLRAVRSFKPDPVSQEVLDDVLEVARWSGSSMNRQPWELVVIRDRDTLGELSRVEGYAGHLAGAPLGIVLVMADERAAYDEGRLSERIMLAALAHGVGSSIGWLTGDGRGAAKGLLGIPEDRVVRTVISMGYPDEPLRGRSTTSRGRKPLEELVHLERYG